MTDPLRLAAEFAEYLRKSGYSGMRVRVERTTTTEDAIVVDRLDEDETDRLWGEFMAAKALGPICSRPH